MARARIQQEYKGTTMKACSSAGWTIKSAPPTMLCEVEFPPLCSPAASAPSPQLASAALSLESTCAPCEAAADQEATRAEMSESANSPVPGASTASELSLDRSQPVATCGKDERRHKRGMPSDVLVKQSRWAGFRLVGGVRVCSKGSQIWQT